MSSAYCAVRFMYYFSNINMLKVICFAYFHSVLKYGIIFWGNSVDSKKSLGVTRESCENNERTKSRISCKPLFKSLKILTQLPYYYCFMTFLILNLEYFTFNFSLHSINARKNVNYIDQ